MRAVQPYQVRKLAARLGLQQAARRAAPSKFVQALAPIVSSPAIAACWRSIRWW